MHSWMMIQNNRRLTGISCEIGDGNWLEACEPKKFGEHWFLYNLEEIIMKKRGFRACHTIGLLAARAIHMKHELCEQMPNCKPRTFVCKIIGVRVYNEYVRQSNRSHAWSEYASRRLISRECREDHGHFTPPFVEKRRARRTNESKYQTVT